MTSSIRSSEPLVPTTRWRKYLQWLLGVAVFLLLLVACTNAVIDPYDIHRWVRIEGLNAVKTEEHKDGGRVSVGHAIATNTYDSLLLGNSRMRTGFLNDYDLLPGVELNAALDGANIFESVRAASLASSRKPLRCVFIGLDFVAFSAVAKIKGAYWNSPLAGGPIVLSKLKTDLSIRTFRRSIATVRENRTANPSKALPKASLTYPPGLQRQWFVDMTKAFIPIYSTHVYDENRVRFLGRMVDRFSQRGVQVFGLLLPIHAWQEETIYRVGQGKAYASWRADLTELFARFAHRKPSRPCNAQAGAAMLTDFSGFRPIATSPVPDEKATEPHPFYLESSHFTPLIGGGMLSFVLGEPIPDAIPHATFADDVRPHSTSTLKDQRGQRRAAWLASDDGRAFVAHFARWQVAGQSEPSSERFFLTPDDFNSL